MSTATIATTLQDSTQPAPDDYPLQLLEKYKNASAKPARPRTHEQDLMAFNGYYTLDTAPGAFFAVDTNIIVIDGYPIYDISLFVSLNGISSYQYQFAGSFSGNRLVQHSMDLEGVNIDLLFTRTDGSNDHTATCAGTIAVLNGIPATVSGYTYNNPIPPAMYAGAYYLAPSQGEEFQDNTTAQGTSPRKVPRHTTLPVMTIGDQFRVSYDYGDGRGLQPVSSYVYNMNMYYFVFSPPTVHNHGHAATGKTTINLIMGTAAAKGFACNNMIVAGNVTTTRSLYTIPGGDALPSTAYYSDSSVLALAGFSGYYPLPAIDPFAFLAIQASYKTAGSGVQYQVAIAVSMDGLSSEICYFDPATMSFVNNELTVSTPAMNLQVTFNRMYDAGQRSLATATGAVQDHGSLTAYNLLNPVPLMAFGGRPLADTGTDCLTLESETDVTYNGVVMDDFIYVPLMYILAWPTANPKVEMSFGTSGLRGNTCIVMDGRHHPTTTAVVYAVPMPGIYHSQN